MKLKVLAVLVAVLAASEMLLLARPADKAHAADTTGTDVSWPNCSLSPLASDGWGIVGVTGGLDFRPNSCLVKESNWFAKFALYMNTGYPGSTSNKKFPSFPRLCSPNDKTCLAYNYGYNAAKYALDYAAIQNIHSNILWLDVETENSWTNHPTENIASLQGMVSAIKHYTIIPIIGYYSSPAQWITITGGWHNYLPTWVATGNTDVQAAITACAIPSFTAGPLWLAQYTPSLDKNYVCYPSFLNSIYNH